MLAVQEGQRRILDSVTRSAPPEMLPLAAALGRVLAADLTAPFDVPPADNSAVDGFAVHASDLTGGGPTTLRVVGDLPAGHAWDGALRTGQALHIMTGAPLPAGATAVCPQEDAVREGDRLTLGPVAALANVRRRGEDVRQGAVVLARGIVLGPPEIGVAASLGLAQVPVRQRPRVALLSTGDEVAEPGTPRRPGQIYDANRFSLRAALEAAGAAVLDLGVVPDRAEALRERLAAAAAAADVVVTSGGVSVGAYDFVKGVVAELGAIDFWQVAMQPGRPLATGRVGGALFFGLPGNPVASMLAYLLFVRPAVWKLAGRSTLFPRSWQAVALEPMRKKVGRREYKRGILESREGRWEVRTTGPQGSGILSSMVAGNCLVVLEEDRGDVSAGEPVEVEPFDWSG